MTIGEKIKSERKKRGLTQSELAGDAVTRNMISLIEKDAANPSLDTLRKIADRLDLPLSYLISDGDDAFYYAKRDAMDGIKAAYRAKSYTTVISRIEKLEKTDDELAYLLTEAYFELGKKAVTSGSLVSAIKYFRKSIDNAAATVYSTERITALTRMYLAVAYNVQAPLLEFDKDAYSASLSESYDLEFYNYLTLNFDYDYKSSVFALHLKAKKLIKEKDYTLAADILSGIELSKRSGEYNAYVIFGIYSDLELCYKQLCDFEKAYKYSSKRLSLLEGFKS